MSQTRNVSIPEGYVVVVSNFFARHPDYCFSRFMLRLLLEEIERQDPELLKLKEIRKVDKPDYDDYMEVLRTAVEIAEPKRITRAQAYHVLNRKFGADAKKAERILKSVDPLLRKHGLEWDAGCLVPFKPYFSERKKAPRAKGV